MPFSTLGPAQARHSQQVRDERAKVCYLEEGQHVTLLVGWPLTILALSPKLDWAELAHEAAASLSNELEPEGIYFDMNVAPFDCEVLGTDIDNSELAKWLSGPDSPSNTPGGIKGRGPALWVGRARTRFDTRDTLKSLFFSTGRPIVERTKRLCLRLEALAEQAGAKVRVFPPGAYWNAISLARLAYARYRIQELAGEHQFLHLAHAIPWLVASAKNGEVLERFFFPDESVDDVAPLVSSIRLSTPRK